MAKSEIQRGSFFYDLNGREFRGSYRLEQGHLDVDTPHGKAHAALNIQSMEQIIQMLLSLHLGGGRLIKTVALGTN
ncbi:hypothetical protein GGD67_003802 [Bradyrhizobium sp. IAR9]|uniref:hypothetical protein n=1 Tax=Bradyrhizobium sp. IAR9 TaxID=2663841 RepID=UPI0015CE723E|nr:hypothetical protein [Bradyrhizobium sp. IAR9]NYG46331.1 hypothetical protein [Bradyrhizobium sp. IAR9]